jgi:hypothetical protein
MSYSHIAHAEHCGLITSEQRAALERGECIKIDTADGGSVHFTVRCEQCNQAVFSVDLSAFVPSDAAKKAMMRHSRACPYPYREPAD